jgi:MFS family permease
VLRQIAAEKPDSDWIRLILHYQIQRGEFLMRAKQVSIVAALFLAQVAVIFESAMLFAALPSLIQDFGSPIMAGWLVTIHALVGAAAAVLAGRLGDI